jgi:hypothetical protein
VQRHMLTVQASQLDLPGVHGRAHWLGSRVGSIAVIALLGHVEQLIFQHDHVSERLDPCDLLLLPSEPKPPTMISQEQCLDGHSNWNSLVCFLYIRRIPRYLYIQPLRRIMPKKSEFVTYYTEK